MPPRLPLPLAYVTAFFAGAAVLMLEMLGSRLMGPFYGTGLEVWAALISVTLVGLSLGYWGGGVLADRRDGDPRVLAGSLVVAAALIGLLPLVASPVLAGSYHLAGLRGGILVSTAVLLLPPLILLGTVSPWLARAALAATERAGRTVGSLYAVSTLGSVLGALVAAFVLIPRLGVRAGMLVVAASTLVPVLLGLGRSRAARVVAAAVLAAAGLPLLGEAAPVASADGRWRVVDRRESAYGEIKVVDDERGRERVCLLDGSSQNWVWLVEPPASLFTYTEVLEDQLPALAPRGGRALVIGLGGGLLPAALERRGVAVDVVEINPQMVAVAERWFGFERAKYRVHVTDGRIFVMEAAAASYDLVILDVAGGGSQPWHLFSAEAFAELARTLKPSGALVVNLLGFVADGRRQIASAVTATVARAFPVVAAWSVSARSADAMTNILLYASAAELPIGVAQAAHRHGLAPFPMPDAATAVLTDDHNPLDLWSAEVDLAWRRGMVAWLGEEVLTR